MNWIDWIQYLAPLVFFGGWFVRLEKRVSTSKVHEERNREAIDSIAESNKSLNDKIFMLAFEQTQKVNFPLTKKEFTRKNNLLDKLRSKTISVEESKELKGYLESEEVEVERKARKTGENWMAVLGITAALFLLNDIIKSKK